MPDNPRPTCWFEARLTDKQREAVNKARTEGHGRDRLAKLLSSWGVSVGRSRIGEHLAGRCRCAQRVEATQAHVDKRE